MSKLAIFGGKKIRKLPMPPRFAFGKNEELEIKKMLAHYKLNNEDPKYSGLWEEKFCQEFNDFMGGGYSDAVATGTGSIYIAMKALELPPKSDVILSPVTCSGAFSCITEQGHTPVIVDSKKDSYNTDINQIKKRITKKTKLIQVTHAAGEPVDMEPIIKFAKKNDIFVLEDCSQAIGAKINGKKVGTFGNIAAFSTMYRKNLAANSSSGIVFTNKNKKLYKKILAYSDRGKISWNKKLNNSDPANALFPALNWNTDEFSCAIGLSSLRRLEKTNKMRNQFLSHFINSLKNTSKVCKPYNYHSGFSPFYFPIFVDKNKIKTSINNFARAIQAEGIPIGMNYGCLVTLWPWAKPYLKDNFITKNSIETRNKCFHLYLNENYKKNEVTDIINAIIKVEKYYIR